MALYAVSRMQDHLGQDFLVSAAWAGAAKGELDLMSAPAYYDVVALAGEILGLSRAQFNYIPTNGAHVGAQGIAALVATLLAYQVPGTGSFSWQSNMLGDLDATTQETAYAVLALVEARAFLGPTSPLDASITDAIQTAATWLVATQAHNGGWLNYLGEFEYAEVDAEAVWALVAAGY